MVLIPGTRLGPYEVTAQIGVGGMGEVYKATDTNLKRQVAIKVLPASVAGDAERLARFQREAEVLAALNNPNIAQIHGLEKSDGTIALVMELVEGPTLADRIAQGPIPVDEALPIAKQIAEALEAAHEQGIIHRDLKPANIKVRPDGTVKVLDFGLAKAMEPAGVMSVHVSQAPTITTPAMMTGARMILGTAAYMSPEQARGRTVDKRADIWAFGVVLYEMLTGRRLFVGDDITEVLAAVIKEEPTWTGIPAKVQRLLKRCLEKDPKRRLHDMADAWSLLEDVPAQSAASSLPWKIATAASAMAVAVIAVFALARPTQQTSKPLLRLDVDLGSDVALGSGSGTDAVISPDGTRLAYVSKNRLFTRRLDQPAGTELAGTDGAFTPFFSPDGQWIGFFTLGKLNKISVEGGSVIALCATGQGGRGASWGEDGTIIASLSGSVLSRVAASGGKPVPVTELDTPDKEAVQRWPQILPGGKAVLFTSNTQGTTWDGANIDVVTLADHKRKTLQRGGTSGRYIQGPDGAGFLLYVNRATLFAIPFDVDRLEIMGTPSPVLEQVAYSPGSGSAQYATSRTGTLVYRSGTGDATGILTVQWIDSTGKTQPLLAMPGQYLHPKLSPDGTRIALDVTEGSGQDVWIYDWKRDTRTRLTFIGTPAVPPSPVWSPDGRYILYTGPGGLYATRTDGAGMPQALTQGKNLQYAWSFAPDGKRFVFLEIPPGAKSELWTASFDGSGAEAHAGKPEPFLQTPFENRHASFSPDGHWMAYASDESGVYQVYVRAFPDKGGKWQISNSGGMHPIFARNTHELFYRTQDQQLMVADYAIKGDSFVADKPRAWTDKRIANTGLTGNYDVAPDGKRIVALMPAEAQGKGPGPNHLMFLEHFSDEVRRLTAAGK